MTQDEISQLAEDLARKHNPGSIAPFPYENLMAAYADLDVHYVDLEDETVSGVTLYENGKYTILVNASKPDTRQHFTLGHELGHYFLHKDIMAAENGIVDKDVWLDVPNMLFRVDDAAKTRMEIEANAFAASLLMPEGLVRRAWEAFGSIEDCARIFKVSAIAMSIRLTRLGLVQE